MRLLRLQAASPGFSSLPHAELSAWLRIVESFPIEWAETVASDKQLRFQEAFLSRKDPEGRPCDIFVALGGNRSGKSFACGWLCFAKYIRDIARDGDWFWCVGQTLDRSIGGQQRELWKALPRWMFGDQRWDEKGGFAGGRHAKISLPTSDGGKCLVEFRSADQDLSTFEQAKLTGVWCDERLPENVYGRLLPRIIDRNGWILYSDIPEQWWQFERLMEAPGGAGVYFQHFTMYDNAHNLPEGAIEKVSLRMTHDERKQKIAGEFVVMEGIVYKSYSENIHVVTPFPIPKEWPRWRLIDYGGSAPTGCPWVTLGPNECAYVYREHYETGPSVQKHAQLIISASGDEVYQWNYIDPAAYSVLPGMNETIAAQYEQAGITPLSGWPRVNQMGEHAMVQKVVYRLENRLIKVFRPCIHTRREFRSWKYKCDKDGKPVAADAFENANNHILDGLKGWCATNPSFSAARAIVVPRRA